MADRPCFAVVAAHGDRTVRLEYYEGHDALSLVHDVRAKELHGADLPRFLESDPPAYDPAAFLERLLGMPREVSRPILQAVHRLERKGN